MNSDSSSLDHRLLALLQAVRDTHEDSARAALNELLRTDPAARAAMARLLVDEQALIGRLRDDSIVSLLDPAPLAESEKVVRLPRWFTWRPLISAAAGIVLGMFCTSMVFGFAAQRRSEKRTPLVVYSPGLETAGTLVDKGLPKAAGRWGADSAVVVTAENGVKPMEGSQMMRLEPIPMERNAKNRMSRVYQVLDLRSQQMPGVTGDVELQVTASFFAAKSDVPSRYLIRAVALSESPEQATKGFWPKTEEDGVVSVKQTFDKSPEERGWHTFSLKVPLPRGAQTLVFVLGAASVDDVSALPTTHYLDDIQVSVLAPQSTQP